jgi:putative DNA primase/helicase
MVSPRLAVDSPTKGCGKTTFLDVLSRLVLKPLPTANVTPSVVFRVVEAQRPTLLIDEGDSFLRDNDELRGVLNSGHRKGGGVLRSVGDEHEPRWFATYSACAIALIGRLPETLHDRSVVINLKRRLPNEVIRSFRSDKAEHLDVLARQVARWAKDNASKIAEADPAMSKGIYNRESDNWRGLIAIADAAGGEWPKLARKALEQCHAEADEEAELGMLLTDIKSIFTGRNTDRVPSHVIVMELWDFEGRPWAEYSYGKPISQNQLARALKPLGIVSQTIRMPDDKTPKGYYLHQFADAFARYLLDSPSQTATPQQMP